MIFSRFTTRLFSTSSTTARKLTIEGLAKRTSLENKKCLVRVDFNVPLSKDTNKTVTDDTRIRESLPTIKFLVDHGAKVILCSHLGRPKGPSDDLRLTPVAPVLSNLLGKSVLKVDDCVGPEVEKAVSSLSSGDVLLLENLRFYKEEEKNDSNFARKLASLADIYVNDAFGTAHRAHASTEGVTKFLQTNVAGFLLEKELNFLQHAVDEPRRPLAAIVGGAKVSTKITVLDSLLNKVNSLMIGGGMMFTFLKAQGLSVGQSLVEPDFIQMAGSLIRKAQEKNVRLLLPTDVIIGEKFEKDTNSRQVSVSEIPENWIGMDIGPNTIQAFSNEIRNSNTIVWNGPMGVFEFPKFAAGTLEIARSCADRTKQGAVTIVGGGDSVAAVHQSGLSNFMSHISTGGGASLELLEGKVLPGVAALNDA